MNYEDREPSTSDELIVAAREQFGGRRRSISAAMAEAARRELTAIDYRQTVPDSGGGGRTLDATIGAPETAQSPLRLAVEAHGHEESSAEVERHQMVTQTMPEPAPPSPVVLPRRAGRRSRRVVALVIAGLVVASIVGSNFDRLRPIAGEQLDRVEMSGSDQDQPATVQEPETTSSVADPIEPPEIVNLALKRPIVGSGVYQANSADRAVDGNTDTAWNAGGYPPQWISIDLGASSTIRSVRLLTGQSPAGETTHQVVGWGPVTEEQVLHEFDGHTADRRWLSVVFDEPISGIQYVAIVTVDSPSWVAWFEIEVNGHND